MNKFQFLQQQLRTDEGSGYKERVFEWKER